jgi:hypothetical protein
MRTLFQGALLGSLALTLAACGSGGGTDPAPTHPGTSSTPPTTNSPSTNSTCANGQQQCSGMNLQVCKNGAWATSTCDSLCQQAGLGAATACQLDPAKGFDTCVCGSASGTCQQGEQKCSGLTLSVCNGGAWSTTSCNAACQQAGLGPAVSCGFDPSKGKDVCICGDAPSTCQNGAQQCQGINLATCTNSTWNTQSCDVLCQQSGMGMAQSCGFDPNKGLDTCFCFNGMTGDPCVTDAHCKDGNICNVAGWCTKPCAHDAECGLNTLGAPNYCMETQGGNGTCFASCSSNTNCASFIGTQCYFNVPSVDGTNANICATP